MSNKRRHIVMEEQDVVTVLAAIDAHQTIFSNVSKNVGNCGWANDPTKWFITFYASDRRWGKIAADLSNIGEITVKVSPRGATELYFKRNES